MRIKNLRENDVIEDGGESELKPLSEGFNYNYYYYYSGELIVWVSEQVKVLILSDLGLSSYY